MKKTILTGITTTGTPHIGNYLGAIKPALKQAKIVWIILFLADYHAIIKWIIKKIWVCEKCCFSMACCRSWCE